MNDYHRKVIEEYQARFYVLGRRLYPDEASDWTEVYHPKEHFILKIIGRDH